MSLNTAKTIRGYFCFARHLLHNPKDNPKEKNKIQLIRHLPHYLDRLIEVLRLYPLSIKIFIKICSNNDFPDTAFFKEKFISEFGDTDPATLYQSYKAKDDLYTLRLMLTYNRIDFIHPYFEQIKKLVKSEKPSALDYGAGVSDIGLYLAAKGWEVTVTELDTRKAEFIKKRFEKRGFNLNLIKMNNTEDIPEINKQFDLIIATEILEHYRRPTELIIFFYEHLRPAGLLINSLGNGFEREKGGDHLDESLKEGNSIEYKKNFEEKFKQIEVKEQKNWLFQQIG
jgi:2-polyprenyl-3-methyl-5-hydroxy-6-metoxy-1,4-benzoquinol methylase